MKDLQPVFNFGTEDLLAHLLVFGEISCKQLLIDGQNIRKSEDQKWSKLLLEND